MKIVCSTCNHEFSDVKNFCTNCGARLTQVQPTNHDTPIMSNGRLLGVLGIASGVIGFLIFPVIFGPAAIVLGILSLNKRNKLGWAGIVLGGLLVLITGIAFTFILLREY